MTNFRHDRSAALLLTACYALAVMLMPLAHRAGASAQAQSAQAPSVPALGAEYRLPDGTLPELCLGGREPGQLAMAVCEACLLTAAPGLPHRDTPLLAPRLLLAALIEPAPSAPSWTTKRVLRRNARAPPVA